MASAQAQINWFRVPVEDKLLKELNTPDDIKGLFQAGGHLFLTLLSACAVFYIWSAELWLWLLPALVLHGVIQGMLGSGVHELVHERVFKTKSLNRIFLMINSFLTGWNYPFFQVSHKDHHRYTLNKPFDLEVTLPSTEDLSKKVIEPNVFEIWRDRFQMYIFSWQGILPKVQLFWSFAKGSHPKDGCEEGIHSEKWCTELFKRISSKEKASIRNWSVFFLAAHTSIVLFSVLSGYWILALIITFGSHFGGFLGHFTGGPQHAGLVDGVNDFRLNCRTYTCNKFFQFLYWNMNFHIEHHMYAAVPCYNLPKLHAAIREYLPPIHNSLYATWSEINHIAFLQKNDPSYRYYQPLPENLKGNEHLKISAVEDKSAQDYLDLTTPSSSEVDLSQDWKVWECEICAFIYDEALGMPEEGIAPGTRWADIPEDWSCPDCGVAKTDFKMIERSRIAKAVSENQDPLYDEAIVIVGSGMAGYTLAKEFRAHNQSQRIVLLTSDGGENYYKPMLSNAFAKNKSATTLISKRAAEMSAELDVEIKTGVEVTSINRNAHTLETTIGTVKYSKLILATGAEQRRLSIQGNAAAAILSVNDLDDYQRFRKQLPEQARIVILGAGLIGCEFANDLISAGYKVSVIDLADAALGRLVPDKVSFAMQERLSKKGVEWLFNTSLSKVEKSENGMLCSLDNGVTIDADLVLSAIGLLPRIELARDADLEINRGIVTDLALNTSDPDIYALGDCSEVGQQVRLFIAPLRLGAVALAKTLAGKRTQVQYPEMPVLIKTPSYPILALSPDSGIQGEWSITEHNLGLECHFNDAQGNLKGFVLTESCLDKKDSLLMKMKQSAL